MYQLLKKILEKLACCHVWQTVEDVDVYFGKHLEKVERTICCSKCGKIKRITL